MFRLVVHSFILENVVNVIMMLIHSSGVLGTLHPLPANLTQGGANVGQLTLTAQFYRQDALTAPNLTHHDANLAQHDLSLLSLLCQVSFMLGQVRCSECVLSTKLGCQCQLCQVSVTLGHVNRGALVGGIVPRQVWFHHKDHDDETQ